MSKDLLSAIDLVLGSPHLWLVVGAAALYGTFMGAMPGLTATLAVALIVPLTAFMTPLEAMAAVVTLEACAIFAGDIPNVLLRMPGTPASAAYTEAAHALTRKGRGNEVLAHCLVFSVAGGLFGSLALALCARPLAALATKLSFVESFWLYVIGLGCASLAAGGSRLRSLLGLLLGLLFSTIGLSPVHSTARFTLGLPQLYQGLGFIPSMIGLFGLSEVFRSAAAQVKGDSGGRPPHAAGLHAGLRRSLGLLPARRLPFLRSASVGTLIGMLPGAGADIAAWVTFGLSRRIAAAGGGTGDASREDDALLGSVSDASAANNASLAGAWVPTLVLGIPGDSVTALVLGILTMKNLRPGPEIFERQGPLVLGLFVVFFLANLALLPVGYLAIRWSAGLLRIQPRVLLPLIVLFCILGAYAPQGSCFDVGTMLVMGLLGLFLERHHVPLGPVVLGIVLGGPLEETFLQTLASTNGSWLGFVSRPIAAVLALCALGLFVGPPLARRARQRG